MYKINVICGGEGQTFCDAIFHLPANNKFPDLHVHTNLLFLSLPR